MPALLKQLIYCQDSPDNFCFLSPPWTFVPFRLWVWVTGLLNKAITTAIDPL